jgi:hypothetical protein
MMRRGNAIRRLELRRCRNRIEIRRVRRLVIRRGVLSRWGGTWIIRTLRMGKNAGRSVTTGGEVPARDEPSNFRRGEVSDIATPCVSSLIVCRRRRRSGRGRGRRIVRDGALRERWDRHARIVGVRTRMWQVISLRRAHVGIVDESRVLGRGVRIHLGSCC